MANLEPNSVVNHHPQHRMASSQDGHRLRKFVYSALVNDFEREHRNNSSQSHTGVGRISTKQSLTSLQLYPAMRRIYLRLGHRSGNVILFFSHSVRRAVGNSPLLLAMFAKGCAFTGIGTPVELGPFSETNYFLFPLKW